MLSSVYQLSSDDDKEAYAKDSGNRLYWRFNRKRLEAEQLRDAVLMVAGNLDPAMGGPSAELTPGYTRRTIYGRVSRYKLDEYLQLFDLPAPNISAEKRFTTTVPLQRLFLMNSDFMQVESEELAKRVATEPDNRTRIRKAYLLIYGRNPTEEEIKLGIDYLKSEPLREYEENKNKPPEPGAGGVAVAAAVGLASRRPPKRPPRRQCPRGPMGMGMGMMAGMPGSAVWTPRRRRSGPPVKYDPTAWGAAPRSCSAQRVLFIN